MKMNTKATCRKSVTFLAAAAMTAALIGGQAYPTVVLGQTQTVEKGSLIPDNVTIDQPTSLSNIDLPKSDYGTLSWVDSSYIPDSRVQSCKVEFKPNSTVDLSDYSGWDAERGVLTGYVTVVVSSIESSGESYEDDYFGSGGSEDETQETSGESWADDTGENSDADNPSGNGQTEAPEESGVIGTEETETPEEPATPGAEKPEESGGTARPEAEETEAPEESGAAGAEEMETPEESGAAGAEETETPEESGAAGAEETETPEESGAAGAEETETPEESGAAGAEETETPEESGAAGAETAETPEESDESIPENTNQENNNIFDKPTDFTAEDTRPSTAEEDLSPEEQGERARQNHSCDGIFVSGIELPWYVQFRVSSGESYEFKNEADAMIFQSYEFELWDLKNNTEYQIPDGEYISVTVPVKEDYSYTIEHILDNGATETIVPSVEGGTMVFSTHSFSPFGIAGSKPLVGGDITQDGYSGQTTPIPTVQATATKQPVQTPAGSSGTITNTNTAGSAGTNTNSNNAGGGVTKEGTVRNIYGNQSGQTNAGSSQNTSTGNSQNTDGSSAVNTVRTGDDTVILPFVILVAAAAVVIAAVVWAKRKKHHK